MFFNWYANPPYVEYNSTTEEVNGLFPQMMEDILKDVCGTCANKIPTFYYTVSRTGRPYFATSYLKGEDAI